MKSKFPGKPGTHKINVLIILALCINFSFFTFPQSKNSSKPLSPEMKALNIKSFQKVWETVRDKHFDPTLGGLDWQKVHDELLPKLKKASTMDDARAVMGDMLSRLKQSHFGIIPDDLYESMNDSGTGDNKSTQTTNSAGSNGVTGLEIRVIDNQPLVTKVRPDSPASAVGIKPGWVITKIGKKEMAPLLEKLAIQFKGKTAKLIMINATITKALTGSIGQEITISFLNAANKKVTKSVKLQKARGKHFNLGYFSFGNVYMETRLLEGNIGYIAFNAFFDIPRLMPKFNSTIKEYINARGIILDLRGNPGGLIAMAMGMSGWFFDKPGKDLGTFITRGNRLKFAIQPRLQTFTGPLVVLIDQCSASTSEVIAAGLQDLGRARILGTPSAGAVLASMIEELPNGDGFQYAVADCNRPNGDTLEGKGVTPNQIIPLSKEILLQGKDPVMDSAIQWIDNYKKTK